MLAARAKYDGRFAGREIYMYFKRFTVNDN